jgi:hypothetical protein
MRLTNLLERERRREVYVNVYDFTTSIPAKATPRILSARIDFESANPAAGVLHFFDADDHDLIGAADQLRGDFNRFIKDLSPGAGFREHQGPLIIATLDPATSENYQPRKPGQHRRRMP